MMFIKRNLFLMFLTFALFVVIDAHAVNTVSSEVIRGSWNAPGGTWDIYPVGHNSASFCLGDTNSGGTCNEGKVGTFGDERAVIGLIARKFGEHGGYFCTTQIQCGNKKKKTETWTWFVEPEGTGNECFWLCKNGYSGEECQAINPAEYNQDVGSTACASQQIYFNKFNDVKNKTTGGDSNSIEPIISALHTRYRKNGNFKDEEDVLLGVVDWLPNKNGVEVAPVTAACNHWNWSDVDSQIFINAHVNLGKVKVCLPGVSGPDCNKCKPVELCSGSMSDYDAAVHKLNLRGTCSVIQCQDPSKGLDGSKKCVDCGGLPKNGIHPTTGECVKCETGKKFNSTNGGCDATQAYSQSDISFGKNKNANSQLDTQCWVKLIPDEYKQCVLGTP